MTLIHRSFKGASGKLHRQYQKGASDPSKEERGFGASAAPGSFHCHRRCTDLPRLPLWVSWRLVGAFTPEVRQITPSLQTQNMKYFQNVCIRLLFSKYCYGKMLSAQVHLCLHCISVTNLHAFLVATCHITVCFMRTNIYLPFYL